MLNESQIAELFKFCRKHYIHYYEVQCELVDHLANNIEGRMLADSKLSFEDALKQAYDAFGGWKGMQHVQEEKRKLLTRTQSKLKWSIFFSYFKIPRIAYTLFLIAASYSVVTLMPDPWNRVFIALSILAAIAFEFRGMWKVHNRIRHQRDRLLLFNNSGTFSFTILSFLILNNLLGILGEAIWPGAAFWDRSLNEIAIFLPLYVVITNSYKHFMEAIYNEAMAKYPEVFKLSS